MTSSPSGESGSGSADASKGSQKEVSRFRGAWNWLEIDLHAFLKMVKFALPPTICLSAYQSHSVASTFTTVRVTVGMNRELNVDRIKVGYIIAIGGILASTLTPRAAFLQNIIVDAFAISLATAVVLLAMWCAIQARKHTTPPGTPLSEYNSSAAAVVGIWLFFMIYLINVSRATVKKIGLIDADACLVFQIIDAAV